MSIPRAKTVDSYVDLVDQAIFEIEELRLATEYDMESLGNTRSFIDKLEKHVRALKQNMVDGSYHFEARDLPFMKIVDQQDDRYLPFKYLLRMINETHKNGLDVDAD